MKKKVLVAIAMIVLAAAILSPYADDVGNYFSTKSGIEILPGAEKTQTTASAISAIKPSKISIRVPAVDNEGNGVTTTLTVQSIPGEGRILADINQLLFWVDTQYSIQTAKSVAEKLAKINTSDIDLIYNIQTEASAIEGPSAGAALAVATFAVLENKTLNPNVAITGTINPDGSIGQVGSVLSKAEASRDAGTKILLVPDGQGVQTDYAPTSACQQIAGFNYCTTDYKKRQVNVTELAGISVIEVADIQQALKYFLT